MSLENELRSIGAINECMADLGLSKSEKPRFDVGAKLANHSKQAYGNITITFVSNWHSGDGAYIETDETIKSFGIPYTSFKPRWQTFTYSKVLRTLTVSGDGYEFEIEFA